MLNRTAHHAGLAVFEARRQQRCLGSHEAPHRLFVRLSVPVGCLRRSLLIGQLHPYNRGGHEESHPPVHLSHEPDRWDGVRYLRV